MVDQVWGDVLLAVFDADFVSCLHYLPSAVDAGEDVAGRATYARSHVLRRPLFDVMAARHVTAATHLRLTQLISFTEVILTRTRTLLLHAALRIFSTSSHGPPVQREGRYRLFRIGLDQLNLEFLIDLRVRRRLRRDILGVPPDRRRYTFFICDLVEGALAVPGVLRRIIVFRINQ